MTARRGHFYVDASCIGCGACDHACPGKVDAIHAVDGDFLGRFVIEPDACIDCAFCLPLCPVACIHDVRDELPDAPEAAAKRVAAAQAWARAGALDAAGARGSG